jgi:hypothetical protein
MIFCIFGCTVFVQNELVLQDAWRALQSVAGELDYCNALNKTIQQLLLYEIEVTLANSTDSVYVTGAYSDLPPERARVAALLEQAEKQYTTTAARPAAGQQVAPAGQKPGTQPTNPANGNGSNVLHLIV